MEPGRVGAVVLAAGSSSRFGAPKPLARLGGRTLLQRVLDALAECRLAETVVVLGHAADEVEAGTEWRDEHRVLNPDPDAGLSSSLRVGIAALEGDAGRGGPAAPDDAGQRLDGALIVLGDQPLLGSGTVAALLASLEPGTGAAAVPAYESGDPNPVLLSRLAWPLALEVAGDRGLGPLLRSHRELVREVPVPGRNPDVDTPADLAALEWAERVRANREQVDRLREVADAADFYGPQTHRFRADPRRTGDAVVDALRSLARPGETWLDIGAGAGRFALPIALLVREVIAFDPSPAMLGALREAAHEAGIGNVRTVEGRWPADASKVSGDGAPGAAVAPADVALIANVGHDVEDFGAFLDAMEAAARRLCVAVMSERQPASAAEPYWPPVHGEPRVTLPSLPDLLGLLEARGTPVEVTMIDQPARTYPDEDELLGFLRGQLWVAPGGPKDLALRELVRRDLVERDGGVGLRGDAGRRAGVVRWRPRAASAPSVGGSEADRGAGVGSRAEEPTARTRDGAR